jgi:hypothetical protein
MNLKQAATIMLELCKIPAEPKLVAAFSNYSANSMWIKSVLKGAAPSANTLNNPAYEQALSVLRENGIDVNIFDTN